MREGPYPDSERRLSPITPRLILGLTLILIGIVFTLDQMGIIDDAWDLLRFWPALLIVAGASKILWPGSSTSRVTGLILLAVGAWLLLEQLDVLHISFWNYWPLLIVFIGLRIAWQGILGRRGGEAASDSASTVNAVAVMGGSTRRSTSEDFRGGDMIAFMGGCEVDLTGARISDPPAVIDAFAFWGGCEIRVPEDWIVIVKGIPLLGGYEDNTHPVTTEYVPGVIRQELVVKGFAIMGGVEVKN